jgi:hypothetical protein
MFLSLAENVNRSSRRAKYVSANNAVRELHVMKAKELHAFIKVQKLLGYFVQRQELGAAAIELSRVESGPV